MGASAPAGFVMLEAAGEDMPEEVLVLALHGRGITALEGGDLQYFDQLRCYLKNNCQKLCCPAHVQHVRVCCCSNGFA